MYLFMNKDLVTNITHSSKTFQIETNGGPNVSTLEATFGNAKVWFNDEVIANVLSDSLLPNYCSVVSDFCYNLYFFV